MKRQGSILIVVLFVLVVLGLATLGLAYRVRLDGHARAGEVVAAELDSLTRSAVAVAIGTLTGNTNGFDHRAEEWHSHPPFSFEPWTSAWDGDPVFDPDVYTVAYAVIDEEAKLNLLYASGEDLRRLGMTPGQIASYFDWIDADSAARAEGAEDSWYLRLCPPYRAKNAPIELLDELLLVRGFTPAGMDGEDADRDGVLDPNEDDGDAGYPPDDRDGELRRGWADLLTCFGDGSININTAPRPVLETLPISRTAVDQIVAFRRFDDCSAGALDRHVFHGPADVEALQGLTDPERDVLKCAACYGSTHFRIFARAAHGPTGRTRRVEAVVRSLGGQVRVLQWKAGY